MQATYKLQTNRLVTRSNLWIKLDQSSTNITTNNKAITKQTTHSHIGTHNLTTRTRPHSLFLKIITKEIQKKFLINYNLIGQIKQFSFSQKTIIMHLLAPFWLQTDYLNSEEVPPDECSIKFRREISCVHLFFQLIFDIYKGNKMVLAILSYLSFSCLCVKTLNKIEEYSCSINFV